MTFPKASVILLTYNQEQFVEEAFLSLLNQDMDDLEIVVSDDCSSDATWERIQALADSYQGSKKIILFHNAENIGIVNNYFAAVKQSTGELIFTAAGDDVSLPERCSKSIQFWLDHEKKYDLVAADAFDMGHDGTILGSKKNDDLGGWTIEKWFERRPFFFGASHMVTRKLVELAPLDGRLSYEDQCLVFRAILTGGAIRLPVSLVCHRRGGFSQQGVRFQLGHRRAQMILDSARGIVELEQFLSDATIFGKRSLAEGLISKKIAYLHSVLNLFRCASIFDFMGGRFGFKRSLKPSARSS
ncbi:glycosyltransferase [Polynucleobacter sp. 80A-SIGWE]|uniref:glycosyltransferase family 2 protein n=1 Tax=Polynucleobacter sp. 80A-SIGWE TaxID=2689100 RepID=UPI001C0AF186|nr:glycosyltransferase [Polynucleobacter sp. 80A-SIGWE]MBU3589064.1 glycosyltransferase [Polynucleobacter sp. 80A-SIGWE]